MSVVDLSEISTFAQLPTVDFIIIQPTIQTELDAIALFVNVPASRLNHGVDGSGVIVGIVDLPLDVTHPDFMWPDSTTKVLYYWNQWKSNGI